MSPSMSLSTPPAKHSASPITDPDILFVIFGNFATLDHQSPTHHDLVRFSRVSKAWNDAANRYIYRHIILDGRCETDLNSLYMTYARVLSVYDHDGVHCQVKRLMLKGRSVPELANIHTLILHPSRSLGDLLPHRADQCLLYEQLTGLRHLVWNLDGNGGWQSSWSNGRPSTWSHLQGVTVRLGRGESPRRTPKHCEAVLSDIPSSVPVRFIRPFLQAPRDFHFQQRPEAPSRLWTSSAQQTYLPIHTDVNQWAYMIMNATLFCDAKRQVTFISPYILPDVSPLVHANIPPFYWGIVRPKALGEVPDTIEPVKDTEYEAWERIEIVGCKEEELTMEFASTKWW